MAVAKEYNPVSITLLHVANDISRCYDVTFVDVSKLEILLMCNDLSRCAVIDCIVSIIDLLFSSVLLYRLEQNHVQRIIIQRDSIRAQLRFIYHLILAILPCWDLFTAYVQVIEQRASGPLLFHSSLFIEACSIERCV